MPGDDREKKEGVMIMMRSLQKKMEERQMRACACVCKGARAPTCANRVLRVRAANGLVASAVQGTFGAVVQLQFG